MVMGTFLFIEVLISSRLMSAGRFPMVLTLATLFNLGDEFLAGGHPSHVDTSSIFKPAGEVGSPDRRAVFDG